MKTNIVIGISPPIPNLAKKVNDVNDEIYF